MAPMEPLEGLVIALVGRPDRGDVFIPDCALAADRLLGPLGDRVTMTLEPDVGKHPSPAAVAVRERVDLDGPVMESYGLVQEVIPLTFPECQVVEQGLEPKLDLVPLAADVQVLPAEFAGPRPDVA